jgi:hypothetical protein
MDQCHENYLQIFYNLTKVRVSLKSFNKFIEGCKGKRIPNKKYQTEVGISRATFYKLVNFLESIVPSSWNKGNLDKKRLVSEETKEFILNKVMSSCKDDAIREMWVEDLNKKKSYMLDKLVKYQEAERFNPKRKEMVDRTMKVKKYNPRVYQQKVRRYCRELGKKLKKLKKLENRLPLLFPEMNQYNILKLSKKRPCPLNNYVNYIRHVKPKYQVQSRVDLMCSIRSAKFKVNPSLKEESLYLDRIRSDEITFIRNEKYRIQVQKKRQERKDKIRAKKIRMFEESNRKLEEIRDKNIYKAKLNNVLKEIKDRIEKRRLERVKFLKPLEELYMKKLDIIHGKELLAKRESLLTRLLNKKRVEYEIRDSVWREALEQEKERVKRLELRRENNERECMAIEDRLSNSDRLRQKVQIAKIFKSSINVKEKNERDLKKKKLLDWAKCKWTVEADNGDDALLEYKDFCHIAIEDKMEKVGKLKDKSEEGLTQFASLPIKRINNGVQNYKNFANFDQFLLERDNIIKEFMETLHKL